MTKAENDFECCPPFHPSQWDGKTFEWENKKFIKDTVFTLFYMPVNFGAVMKRSSVAIEKSNSKVLDGMWLAEHTSLWNMNLYTAVDREVTDSENIAMSGKYISRVYEGTFKEVGAWDKDFKHYVQESGNILLKTYQWYTTCPKCAKKYGKNYVVFVGQVQ
ncbi:TPA: hypothetical protein DEP58_04385 [Patescibacteria group bacterium]|nr:MAG: hypothetical protein UU98_C0023G0006 [Parcubacteria group bacterium GW2011_GWD2_42_14]HCC05508.1 hypothetical protein [Patescibacteria group bacterium]